MASDFHAVAKNYILYRQERAKSRQRDIFKKRINLKPNEYPELLEYVDAVRHSYWIHTEFNFTSDIQDFKVNITDVERSAIKNSMLAIAQIEVSVKTFWADIYKKMPKPEIAAVGVTFAESEVRHQDAYSHLLEILGLNEEFSKVREIPAVLNRINYLEKSIKNSQSDDPREYAQSVLIFSLFIEHVSLFSQFLIMMAFNKHKNLFKGVSNAVEATSKEEQIHGLFGIDLINIIKSEHPEWFDEEYNEVIIKACREALEAESNLVDWIFEEGELDFLPKNVVIEFIKNRFNNSLESIGIPKVFETDEKLLDETEWFDDEVIGTKHGDFFDKRSINYNKRSNSVTGDDLF
jgi:ribonucleoside-diphosphate reductase beta chain